MSTFLMLSTVGPDGAATLAENPDRLKAVNAEVEAMGVRVLAQWALLGPYDFCTVLDAPTRRPWPAWPWCSAPAARSRH